MLRRAAAPAAGLALAAACVATMASVYSENTGAASPAAGMQARALFTPQTIAQFTSTATHDRTITLHRVVSASLSFDGGGAKALIARVRDLQDCSAGCERLASTSKSRAQRLAFAAVARPHEKSGRPHVDAVKARFDSVAADTTLARQKLAAAFAHETVETARADEANATPAVEGFEHIALMASIEPDLAVPSPARFGQTTAEDQNAYLLALALPDDEQSDAPGILASVTVAAVEPQDMVAIPAPEDMPLPSRRPAAQAAPAEKIVPPVVAKISPPTVKDTPAPKTRLAARNNQMVAAAPKLPSSPRRDGQTELAYAPPDDGAGSVGQAFKNLFSSGPGKAAGNGVAVYDISAGTVTMPDGQKLEAHSGIGHMADNPRYVGEKMRGPTPPDTYKLVLRESRFHGVEAIRMLPVDGKVKYGRTGLLAHTELLRGRRGQSHGCVAFKDYAKFLAAFKKGKVTRMVVVG